MNETTKCPKRGRVSSIVTEKVLAEINDSGSHGLLELVSGDPELGLRNLCAKITPQLSDEVEGITKRLGIQKRTFVEAAIIDAIDKAQWIIRNEGLHEAAAERAERSEEAVA